MSTFVCYAGAGSVQLLADTAVTDEATGRIAALVPKCAVADGHPYVIAARGDYGLTAPALSEIRSQRLDLDAALGWVRTSLIPRLRERRLDGLSFLIAGISPTRGAMFASFETRFPGQMMPRPPYVLHEEAGDAATVLSHLYTAELASVVDLGRLGRRFDTEGIKIMDHCRSVPLARGGVEFALAAGQVQHYTISAAGVQTRTMGYWPDLIGEKPAVGRKFVWAMQ